MAKIKAILIDVDTFEVSEIDIEQDNIKQIYKAIRCDTFDCVGLPNGDAIYVDDEGLLNDPQRFFAINGETAILAGNGLIMGTGPEGESVNPKTSIDHIRDRVHFFVKGGDGWIYPVVQRAPMKAPQPGFTITEFE